MEVIVYDHIIRAVNRSKAENFSDTIIYREDKTTLHRIELAECAKNYKQVHPNASDNCIGERNIEEGYLLLYTNGIRTRIIFKKPFVMPFNCLLHGTRRERFLQLQKYIEETKYTTYDLT